MNSSFRLAWRFLCSLIISMIGVAAHAGPDPLPAVPFELQPYQIRISLAFADSPSLQTELRKAVLREMPIAAERWLGEMWSVSTDENRWLLPITEEHLADLTVDQLPPGWISESHDKTFLIAIEFIGGEYIISGREWDHVGRVLSAPTTRRVMQRIDLPTAVFKLCHALFRPLLTVEKVEAGIASIAVKAGALPPADPSCVQLKPNQYWQPFMRFRTPKGEVEKCTAVPWTLLQVQEVSPRSAALGQAKVISGLRSAMPSRGRARMDLLARALEPVASETVLRLVSRKNPEHPLVGVVIEGRTKQDAPTIRFMTDRDGSVRIPVQRDEPLIWLFVRSGEKTLARLPMVPGLEKKLQAELPDDSIRLRVEGELSILQANLTDTVAQRAVYMARIRKLVQFNDWKLVPELKRDLRLLPGTDYYLKELNAIRIPSLQAANAAKDKSTAAYIERACSETSIVIQKYLDDEKLRNFEDELKELEHASQLKPKAAPAKKE